MFTNISARNFFHQLLKICKLYKKNGFLFLNPPILHARNFFWTFCLNDYLNLKMNIFLKLLPCVTLKSHFDSKFIFCWSKSQEKCGLQLQIAIVELW